MQYRSLFGKSRFLLSYKGEQFDPTTAKDNELQEWSNEILTGMAWWVTLWVLSAIMSMTTPPVSGGTISCLTIMLNQLGVPAEGLAIAVTLAMFLDLYVPGHVSRSCIWN